MFYLTLGMVIVLTSEAQPDVIDSPAIRLKLHLSRSVQANEFKECLVPGKFRAAIHQLLKFTFMRASKLFEDPICKGLVSRHQDASFGGTQPSES